MRNTGGTIAAGNRSGLSPEHDLQNPPYPENFMNIDDNLFGLDSESRDLIFGTPSIPYRRSYRPSY